ncbi:MAG TPA: hypothetical protein VFI96_04275 [Longimicrobiaceae bacterium]|nr:hypothetical protein [Longimicrobiaceae bacterium]
MHHSSTPDPEMEARFRELFAGEGEDRMQAMEEKLRTLRESEFAPKLGATGRFPEGPLTSSDEGGIRFQIGVIDRKVIIDFGQEVVWVGMDAKQARALARTLLKHADRAS